MKKIIFSIIALSLFLVLFVDCFGLVISDKKIRVTAIGLNVRKGPGMEHSVIDQVYRDDILAVIGEENDWYLVRLKDNSYGMIYSGLTESLTSEQLPQGSNDEEEVLTDAQILFSMTNEARMKNNLQPFTWDEELNEIALEKCRDMIENNYFGHQSPVYGTPFKMLKSFGIEYGYATENLARSGRVETAFSQIMASPSHRSSVLNHNYNRIGVAVLDKNKYSKLIVQIFVGN